MPNLSYAYSLVDIHGGGSPLSMCDAQVVDADALSQIVPEVTPSGLPPAIICPPGPEPVDESTDEVDVSTVVHVRPRLSVPTR